MGFLDDILHDLGQPGPNDPSHTVKGSDLKGGEWVQLPGSKVPRQTFKGEDGKIYVDTSPNVHDVCFITTAVCQTLKKPDDCAELTQFRQFRDTFMQKTAEMRAEVQEYYDIAPKICAAIDSTGEKAAAERYASIWESSLKPAFAALDKGDNQAAHDLYRDMVIGLKQEYIDG